MDEDIIEDIADAFRGMLDSMIDQPRERRRDYKNQCLDDIILMAEVIARWQPTYDLRYFYRRAGYPEPYPIHPMER